MSEPVPIGTILQDLYPPCAHRRTEVRYRTFANGTKHLATQCLDCGCRIGAKWLSQEGVNLGEISPWDDALEQGWARQRQQDALCRRKKDRVARHEEYERYLSESENWPAIRLKVMRRDNYRCQACLEVEATQVHHKSYEHIFDELMWELVAVCRRCHERLHGIDGPEEP